jgi:hypothetical protein
MNPPIEEHGPGWFRSAKGVWLPPGTGSSCENFPELTEFLSTRVSAKGRYLEARVAINKVWRRHGLLYQSHFNLPSPDPR